MELKDPVITVTNTTGGHWQVRMQLRLAPLESIDIALLLPRGSDSLVQLRQRLLAAAIEHLTNLRDMPNS